MDILGKIIKLQNERNWSNYELAQRAEIPPTTLAAILYRNNIPKVDTLQKICSAFGLSLAQFFLEDEEMEMLSETEKEMLHRFRRLSPKQQKALISVFTE